MGLGWVSRGFLVTFHLRSGLLWLFPIVGLGLRSALGWLRSATFRPVLALPPSRAGLRSAFPKRGAGKVGKVASTVGSATGQIGDSPKIGVPLLHPK